MPRTQPPRGLAHCVCVLHPFNLRTPSRAYHKHGGCHRGRPPRGFQEPHANRQGILWARVPRRAPVRQPRVRAPPKNSSCSPCFIVYLSTNSSCSPYFDADSRTTVVILRIQSTLRAEEKCLDKRLYICRGGRQTASVTPPLVLSAHATRCPRVGPALEVWHQGSPCTSLPVSLRAHFARKLASV